MAVARAGDGWAFFRVVGGGRVPLLVVVRRGPAGFSSARGDAGRRVGVSGVDSFSFVVWVFHFSCGSGWFGVLCCHVHSNWGFFRGSILLSVNEVLESLFFFLSDRHRS